MEVSKIWFSSDFHFSHTNIVRGCSRWKDLSVTRDFGDVWHHNTVLLDNINKTVAENDKLYFLGDFSFNGHINIEKYRKLINCKDIEFIIGNHDDQLVKHKEYHELFTTILQKKTITIDDYTILMNHRPIQGWNLGQEKNDKFYHLYGHLHGNTHHDSFSMDGYSMDVGVDCHPEFRPFSFEEIKEFMSKK